MSERIAIESPATAIARNQPLLTSSTPKKSGGANRRGSRVGETAGECAAVCCCCPCAMMHLLILAVYRLPAGLWRKKRKLLLRRKRKNNSRSSEGENEIDNQRKKKNSFDFYSDEEDSCNFKAAVDKNDVVEWEKEEIWERFYGAGFWRSGSQRTDDDDES